MTDFLRPSPRARLRLLVSRRRTGILVFLAAVLGAAAGWLAPLIISPLAHVTGADRPVGQAASALAALPVRESTGESLTDDPFGLAGTKRGKEQHGPARKGTAGSARTAKSLTGSGSTGTASAGTTGASETYSRDAFAYQQIDPDGDGCTIREDILRRDLTGIRSAAPDSGKPSCTVLSGRLHDPYTGKDIAFRRGRTTSSRIQIDHVVALHNAWDSGASRWDVRKRRALGNDPQNLLAVSGPANQEKSDADASGWLPSDTGFRCEYVARQIGVKSAYGLSVTAQEKNAMRRQLTACPGQRLVTRYPHKPDGRVPDARAR